MMKFEVGKVYSMRSNCDHNCIWSYTVVERTEKTIIISDGKEVKKCRINKQSTEFFKAEAVYPLGSYSMCPILVADGRC